METTQSRQVTAVVGISFLFVCTSCTSISSIDSPYQQHIASVATHTAVRWRLAAREAADKSSSRGALVFIDPATRQFKYSLPGNSPVDAWLRYAATSKATIVDDLPLPSSLTPTAIFVLKSSQAGTTRLVYTADLDNVVKERYDLSSALLRLGAAIQQLRDVTILLSLSDQKQNAAIKKISDDVAKLGENLGDLGERFQQLSRNEHDANSTLEGQLRDLSSQLDDLQNQIAKIK